MIAGTGTRVLCALVVLVASASPIAGYIRQPGPRYVATVGHPWPLPKTWTKSDVTFGIDRRSFKFEVAEHNCDLLKDAIKRYSYIIFATDAFRRRPRHIGAPQPTSDKITALHINLSRACEDNPYLGMNESYRLKIDKVKSTLFSDSIWGILRGLETFSQLIVHTYPNGSHINQTQIEDEPRFSHRGLLVDTSRHYIQPRILKQILDGMSYNKLNVFHWHIVDDESFPYVSIKFPELSEKGAYMPEFVYSQAVIRGIREYARDRGIRVIVEIDSPGHTRSWGQAFIELLTKCYGTLAGSYGPIDPTKETTYQFMREFLAEIVEVFPDDFLHIGADEVTYECWRTNPFIKQYMAEHNYTHYNQLQSEYVEKVHAIVNGLNRTSVVWQEAFQSELALRADTVVHVWIENGAAQVMFNATKAGYRTLLSAGWYLDHLTFSSDFPKMWQNEPTNFTANDKQKALVMGGEACMWSEMVNDESIMTRIFPRVGAAAERLWSHQFDSLDYALRRIEEHACRLNRRRIRSQPPSAAGFCD